MAALLISDAAFLSAAACVFGALLRVVLRFTMVEYGVNLLFMYAGAGFVPGFSGMFYEAVTFQTAAYFADCFWGEFGDAAELPGGEIPVVQGFEDLRGV